MKLPILCYHNVSTFEAAGRRLNIEPAVLESHASYFKRRGFRFVCARELASEWPNRSICFTFDDAYASMLDEGVEVLAKVSATASIYAVTSLIGRSSIWDKGNEKPLATEKQLRTAADLGFEIGNHTLTHADLSSLDEGAQRREIEEAQSRLLLDAFRCGSIAYPFGKFNETTVGVCRSLGLRVGVALSRRPANPDDDRLRLPRIVVGYGDRLPKLLYKIHIRPFLPSFKKRAHYVD